MLHRLLFFTLFLILTALPALGLDTEQLPLGQSSQSADELFDTQRGYLHPYLTISGLHTDNLFNTAKKESDFLTIYSPGIWMAFPGMTEPAKDINTESTAVGGLPLDRYGSLNDRRFQAYLHYGADIKRHQDFTAEDITTHRAEVSAMGNFSGGLRFEAFNVYRRTHDAYGTGLTSGLSKYDSNLFGIEAGIGVLEKLGLVLDYSNFLLDYDDLSNRFRNRVDRSFGVKTQYRTGSRTTPFIEYRYTDVAYDTHTSSDSTQHKWFVGSEWDVTDKTSGIAKVGYGKYERNAPGTDRDSWLGSLQLNYDFTPKTALTFVASRNVKEADTYGTEDILSHDFSLVYTQKLARKLTGTLNLGWSQDDYAGLFTDGLQSGYRTDDYLNAGVAVGFAVKKWFDISSGYDYVKRDSNFENFSYDNNTVFLSLSGKI